MSKTIILPILTVLAMGVQLVFGITIPEDVISDASLAIANVIAIVIAVAGVIQNHKKKEENEASIQDEV